MTKYRIWSAVLLFFLVFLVYFNYSSERPNSWANRFAFNYGLDLVGGTELIYQADTSTIPANEVGSAMDTLQEVIERRVNVFGVSEPLVQIERAGVLSGNPEERLIVELPGYSNVEEAKAALGETPVLEFRLESEGARELLSGTEDDSEFTYEDLFVQTGLTGRFLERSRLEFGQTGEPVITLEFNEEGRQLFANITSQNVGKILAIFLDGELIEAPIIQDEITVGTAVITGIDDAALARDIVRQLNYGALPLPIELISTQTVGATLGERALQAGTTAGLWGFALIALFLLFWYRLPGVVATVALIIYVALSLAIFKLVGVTLTAAGIAGFILSLGMAVDANILIFERMKEELRRGKNLSDSMREGFSRAWLSIRDSNISSIITSIVLFWIGTSAVRGFALMLGIGVVVSMFTAITVSRTFLFALEAREIGKWRKFFFGTGLNFRSQKQ